MFKLYEKGYCFFFEVVIFFGWTIDEVFIEGGDDRYVLFNFVLVNLIGVFDEGEMYEGVEGFQG